jgi:hypothetical protein
VTSSPHRGPVELEWLEISAAGGDTRTAPTTLDRRPPGATLLDRGLSTLNRRDARPAMRGTDLAIRRVLFVPFDAAAAQLDAVLADLVPTDAHASRHGSERATITAGRGRVVIDRHPAVAPRGNPLDVIEVRRPGRVHAHRLGPALAVDLVLAPWSAWQSELRLQLHGGRGTTRLPRHYYDVAHPALAALRDLVELRPHP